MDPNDLLYTNSVFQGNQKHPLNKQIPPGAVTHMDAQFSQDKDLYSRKLLNENYYEKLLREGCYTRYVVNFDTRFRKNPDDQSTNCLFVLPEKIVNIIAIRLATIELPNIFEVFTEVNGNITFQIIDETSIYEVTIPEGNYESDIFIDTVKSLLPANYTISLDPYSKQTTIENTNGDIFELNFNIGNNCGRAFDWGIGYNMGYRKKIYSGSSSYTSEGLLNVVGFDYLFMEFDDFNLNDKQMVMSYVNRSLLSTKLIGKIILRDNKYTISFDDGRDLLTKARVYKSPVNIERVHMKILDPYGNVVNLINNNFSFTMEFLVIS